MLGSQVSIGQAAVVCVFSMVVIFAVLFVISLMIDILSASLKKQKAASPAPAAPAAPAQPAAQDGVDIAVITGAVAVYLGKSTDEIVVREIRRVQNNESEWSRSGRTEALRGE